MKFLNFSVLEILPSLLDKSKTQTIRPAWKKIKLDYAPHEAIESKPPTHKVGDKVKLLWNQRSKYKAFCKKCGEGMYNTGDCLVCSHSHSFNKILGTIEITEVFKIEIGKDSVPMMGNGFIHRFQEFEKHLDYWIKSPNKDHTGILAKQDGFRNVGGLSAGNPPTAVEQMFKTIDNMYDLSTSKEFYVTRWKWL